MRFTKIVLLAIVGLALTTGCVTTKKYEARLSDIIALNTENTKLGRKLQETEDNLKKETAAREELETDVANLREEKKELMRTKELLFTANKDINKSIAEISNEKLMAIKERDRAIAEQRHEYDNVVSELTEEIKKGKIEVKQLKDKLTLTMVEKILFDSGRADIKENGKKVLDRVAEILKDITDKQIRIEGYTDNVRIGPVLAEKFPTNWELSTSRASTVVRYLQEKGVNPVFLSAVGYSEYRPVESNETEEGRAKNRRIEIVLTPLDTENIKPQ